MPFELDEAGKSRWRKRLVEQRGKRSLAEIGEIVGRTVAPLSRFENGEPKVLANWFETGTAAKYALAVGVSLEELQRWLREASRATLVVSPWHPAFPGIELSDAFVSPPMTVRGLEAKDFCALVTALKARSTPTTVLVHEGRGRGRTTVLRLLQAEDLPACVRVLTSTSAAPQSESGKRTPSSGDEPISIELHGWDGDQIQRIAERLFDLRALDSVARERARQLADQLRDGGLALGPATSVSLIAGARRRGVTKGAVLTGIAEAQASAVGVEAGFDALDPRWLIDFWAHRRLVASGERWTRLSRAEAIAVAGNLLSAQEAEPVDRRGLRLLLDQLPPTAKLTSVRSALFKQLWAPSPSEVVDAMVAAEVLVADREGLTTPDPTLAGLFAAEGLRLRDIVDDPQIGWALDPSWRPVLSRLGALGVDPTPLVAAWRRASFPVRVHGVIALAHFLCGGPNQGAAEDVREIHAAAVWTVMAFPAREDPAPDPTLWGLKLTLRDPTLLLRALSRVQAAALGYLEPEPLEALAARVPADLRRLGFGGGPLADVLDRHAVPAERQVSITVVWLCPWQCPPVDFERLRGWWRDLDPIYPLATTVDAVLDAAAKAGHLQARALLSGDAKPAADPGQGLGHRVERWPNERGWTERTVPVLSDPWENLDWRLRCQWVGRGFSSVHAADRLEALVRASGGEARTELIEAGRRLSSAVVLPVVDALLRERGSPDLPEYPRPAWATETCENAELCVRLAIAAGAQAALERLDSALAERAGRQAITHAARSRWRESATALTSEGRSRADVLVARVAGVAQVLPGWLTAGAEYVGGVLRWEALRHEIAVVLAKLGAPTRLRQRGLEGAGLPVSGPELAQRELTLLLWGLAGSERPWTLVDLARRPGPAPEAVAFLSAVRKRGLARYAELEGHDVGGYFPPANLAGPAFAYALPEWLTALNRELVQLPELADSARGARVAQTLSVLGWLFTDDSVLRDEIPEALWAWLQSGCWLPRGGSTSQTLVDAVDHHVRSEAATALIAMEDVVFIDEVEATPRDDSRWHRLDGARAAIHAALREQPTLRKALWEKSKLEAVQDAAYREECFASAKWADPPTRRDLAVWAQSRFARDLERRRERVLELADPLTRSAEMMDTDLFSAERAEADVLRWWTGPEALALPDHDDVLFSRRAGPLTRDRLFQFVGERVRDGSTALIPSLLALWEAILLLPMAPAKSLLVEEDRLVQVSVQPPGIVVAIVALIKQLPNAAEVVRCSWERLDPVCVQASAWELAGYHRIYAEPDDAVPVCRHELHRCWLLKLCPELLDPRMLLAEVAEPGLLRMILRNPNIGAIPKTLVPWIRAHIADSEWKGHLWPLWAAHEPVQAWAWLQARLLAAEREPDWLPLFAAEVVDHVEHAVPGARRWLAELQRCDRSR